MSLPAVFNSICQTMQHPMFRIGGKGISLISFVCFAIPIVISVLISRLVIRFLKRNVYSKTELAKGAQYTLSRLIKDIIMGLGILTGLQMIGFNLTIIHVFGGLFGVGVGFGLQNIFSNFASGIILLLERPIQVGDIIEIANSVDHVVTNPSPRAYFKEHGDSSLNFELLA